MDNLFKNSGCGCLFLVGGVFLAIYAVAAGIQAMLHILVPAIGIDAAGAVGVASAIILFVVLVTINWKRIWR